MIQTPSRAELINLLENNNVQVTFTKKNNATRVMNCTLQVEQLPKRVLTETTEDVITPVNTDIIPVFDTDINGWRSFRMDSIDNITVK